MYIDIPYQYNLRDYQRPLWDYLESGGRRACYVWHRRAGKDLIALNWLISSAVHEQIGTYWHVFPTYRQGKKAIWDETDKDGKKYLDHIPKDLIKSKNDMEMRVELWNGSSYQIVGSDNVDSLRGANIKGVAFSEFSEQRPSAWEVIQPMIESNNGFALFNFTPKGQNHAYKLFEYAKSTPTWFSQILTVEDTIDQVFTLEQITRIKEEHLAKGKTLDLFNQEYYCSFAGSVDGAYYATILADLEKKGRIGNYAHDPVLQVSTWWDLGISDATAIWFTQTLGNEIRIIDYYENQGHGMQHYIKYCKDKPYIYDSHNAPHDIRVREFSNGKSRLETAYNLGMSFNVVPHIPIIDGINAVRSILPRCYFDKSTIKGLESLKNYKKSFKEIVNCYDDKPLHDWTSHAADAFRYFAVGFQERIGRPIQKFADY